MLNKYKVLQNQVFNDGDYSIVPIRLEDRYSIMEWRNEQIYHLRQNKHLTKSDQDHYFSQVVSKLFDQERPDQILFSYLKGDGCIGYGGLVHINWTDRNAEISFIMDTELENDYFEFHWKTYLNLIEQVAFEELHLHKIFTYAFDLRPKLYDALEQSGFEREARLEEHCLFESRYIDVIIHSKINDGILLRKAANDDLMITYSWANHPHTRQYAFSRDFITFENHTLWFNKKLADPTCVYYILEKNREPIGSIRFDIKADEALISYLISLEQTGKGYGMKMLAFSFLRLAQERPEVKILKGQVKEENAASVRIFENLQFEKSGHLTEVLEFKKSMNHADRSQKN